MNLLVDHPFGDALAGIEVPNWCHGVWQRERLAWPGGEDRAKTVLWIQTPVLFADLRVPPPGQVGEEQGFAGHLLVSGRICAWQRPLDLKPPSGPGDAGEGGEMDGLKEGRPVGEPRGGRKRIP